MVTHKGEHTMLSDPGANAALSPDDLPHDLFVPGAHLHVSGYTLLSEGARAAGLAAIDYARRTNMTASVDAASAAPLERAGAEPFLELSSGAVLLFVNAAQAKVLTGREDPEQAARVLTAWYPHVAVKMAADGALFYANGRPPVRVPAPPVDRVIDGTGAGDAFIAGFLPAWLDKKPPGEALAGGCRLAAHALGLTARAPFCERSTALPGGLFSLDGRRRGHRRVLGDHGWPRWRAGPGSSWWRGTPGGWRRRRPRCTCAGANGPRRRGSARTWPNGPGWRGPLSRRPGRSARRTSWSTARGSTCGRRWGRSPSRTGTRPWRST
jgi:hypothetical protein